MTLDFDPSDDLPAVADGSTAVTITRPGSAAATEVAHALRRPIRTQEAQQSGGRYTASDVTWHLPAAELATAPRPGDVIVDAGGRRWTVLDAAESLLDGRWRCVARCLAIVHGLDDYVEIEKAVYTKGQRGAEKAAWHTWKTGLRARIQPVEVEATHQHERHATAARFIVFLADDVPLDPTCRIRGPDGAVYRVIRYRKAQRIDAVAEIEVVRIG